MFDRLQAVEDRYERLTELLSDPDIVNDSKNYVNIPKNNQTSRKLSMLIVNIKV